MRLLRWTAALSWLVLVLAGCHRGVPSALQVKPVVAVAAQANARIDQVRLPGQIASRHGAALSFRVAGKIIERKARLGDKVQAGQVLAQLDPSDLNRTLATARAQLDAAEHQLRYALEQLQRDQAQIHERLIAPAQFEATRNAHAAALAQRDQAKQQLALADNQAQYTTLKADHDGVITAERADTDQNVAAGQVVYEIAWSGQLDAICDAPETVVSQLARDQHASLTLAALPGRYLNAHVREIAPATQSGSRTFRVKLSIAQPLPELKLGMTVDIAFDAHDAARTPTFMLPATALFHDGADPALWIVKPADDTLELRRVRIDHYGERSVTVAAGIQAGERVVWQGVHTVTAGQKVRVVAPLRPELFSE